MAKPITKLDELKIKNYFRIVCSDPFDLSPLGSGSPKQLLKAWHKVIADDERSNPGGSYSQTRELYEDHERLSREALRIYAAIAVLSFKDSPETVKVLEEIGITAPNKQALLSLAADIYKGRNLKIKELERDLQDRKRPTLTECYAELATINTYGFSLTGENTMMEYRGAQEVIRKRIAKNTEHGQSDN